MRYIHIVPPYHEGRVCCSIHWFIEIQRSDNTYEGLGRKSLWAPFSSQEYVFPTCLCCILVPATILSFSLLLYLF